MVGNAEKEGNVYFWIFKKDQPPLVPLCRTLIAHWLWMLIGWIIIASPHPHPSTNADKYTC